MKTISDEVKLHCEKRVRYILEGIGDLSEDQVEALVYDITLELTKVFEGVVDGIAKTVLGHLTPRDAKRRIRKLLR